MVIVMMGVSGSGKTTVGTQLAAALGWPFYDGDDFQPAANIAKMRVGTALSDEDRVEWLDRLVDLLAKIGHSNAVLACSALKTTYRAKLRQAANLKCVYLKGDPDLLHRRLAARQGHYFGPELLASQLQTLEVPQDAITLDSAQPPEYLVQAIKTSLFGTV